MTAIQDRASLFRRLAFVGVFFSFFAQAEDKSPRVGTVVEETRKIELRDRFPAPCIAVDLTHVTVIVSQERIESFTTESGHLSIPANNILAELPKASNRLGCIWIERAVKRDTLNFLVGEIEKGEAAVILNGTYDPVRELTVQYYSRCCGMHTGFGFKRFYLPGTKEAVISLSW